MQERKRVIYMTLENIYKILFCVFSTFVSLKCMASERVTKLLETGQTQFLFFSVRKKTQQSPETPP